jgi:hypothetical protein
MPAPQVSTPRTCLCKWSKLAPAWLSQFWYTATCFTCGFSRWVSLTALSVKLMNRKCSCRLSVPLLSRSASVLAPSR